MSKINKDSARTFQLQRDFHCESQRCTAMQKIYTLVVFSASTGFKHSGAIKMTIIAVIRTIRMMHAVSKHNFKSRKTEGALFKFLAGLQVCPNDLCL